MRMMVRQSGGEEHREALDVQRRNGPSTTRKRGVSAAYTGSGHCIYARPRVTLGEGETTPRRRRGRRRAWA
nr:MAG TPA: hypothetical protein [Caudoviricetes sp.]